MLVPDIWSLPRGLRERHSVVQLDPAVPRVSLYCKEESHEDEPWFVASFVREDTSRWSLDPYYPTADGAGFWIGLLPMRKLVGDKWVGDDDMMAPYDPQFRVKYNLTCRTCDLGRTRRADEINRDLERLWLGGVVELSIRTLAAL